MHGAPEFGWIAAIDRPNRAQEAGAVVVAGVVRDLIQRSLARYKGPRDRAHPGLPLDEA